MADINLANIPVVATAPTVANDISDALYRPDVAATSFAEINGLLDNANRQAGWDVRSGQIRNRSMADGMMVGATGVLDYPNSAFPQVTSGSTTVSDEARLPGASIQFYLPVAPSITILTWQVVTAGDHGALEFVEHRLHVDGARQTRQFRQAPQAATVSGRMVYRDRIWSGSWASTSMTRGWHNASITLWTDTLGVARVRVRNMKVVWFR